MYLLLCTTCTAHTALICPAAGSLFAVGAHNMLRLCDKTGVSGIDQTNIQMGGWLCVYII